MKELLVPVGSMDSLKAAVMNGADAIYLGGKKFGARARAVNFTDEEMEEAINSMTDLDVVLIDTTGRSSKNNMQISELRAFVQKANPDHTLMVMSSTTKNKDVKMILKGYEQIEYEKLIITKLDETSSYGIIHTILKESNKPVAFLTTGQNVPNDIRIPSKDEIIKLIMGEDSI